MKIEFTGLRALVTGASQGIGKEIALALANNGAEVFGIDMNAELLSQLEKENTKIKGIVCNLTQSKEEIAKVVAPHFPFHLLVNCAGVTIIEQFLEMKEKSFDTIMNVNLKAMAFLSQIVAGHMVQKGIKGSIVQMSSQASQVPLDGHTAYCCSKAGVEGLVRVMAKELGPSGIRVNAVCPTVVMTDMGRKVWSDPQKAGPMLARIPLNRFAEVHEVVNAVLFLLSDLSSMTTGALLPVDGGAMSN